MPCRQGYGLARRSQTVPPRLWANTGCPQCWSSGREARLASATLVAMEPWEQLDLCWRSTADAPDFAAWLADRCAVTHDHLVGVAEVGRDETGALVARAAGSVGLPLPDALDRIGTPTVGVAVTLTVPLLEVALLADAGALLLGTARVEDVLVDDAGAVVLVDRPPGTTGTVPAGSVAGVQALVSAVRAVWDRVDPREHACADVDALCSAARSEGGAALVDLEQAVRAAAPPRPVRWDPVPFEHAFVLPASPVGAAPGARTGARAPVGQDDLLTRVIATCRDVLTSGIPIGGRRFGVRPVVTAVVLASGLVVAGVTALGPRPPPGARSPSGTRPPPGARPRSGTRPPPGARPPPGLRPRTRRISRTSRGTATRSTAATRSTTATGARPRRITRTSRGLARMRRQAASLVRPGTTTAPPPTGGDGAVEVISRAGPAAGTRQRPGRRCE